MNESGVWPLTPAQTIGPFFAVMRPLAGSALVEAGTPGAITVVGDITDGAGAPVTDALVEIWQAGPDGEYARTANSSEDGETRRSTFAGFGRCATGPDGRFKFVTLKPGPVAGFDERMQAPHINVAVFARGLLRALATRLYFPDEVAANARDPLLTSIADPAVRATLLAVEERPGVLRFDIRLRGEGETAFLEV